MIDGRTKVFGLIGNPVTHTLSPIIHNQLAANLNMNLCYLPFEVEDGLDRAIAGAYALGIQGMNVTVPYKSEVIPYLSEVDEEALCIGAVNTLVRNEKGYIGYNTDLYGLEKALESENIFLNGQKVLILGAGGAARAAAFLCAGKCAEKIIIMNRSKEHAQKIIEDIRNRFTDCNIEFLSFEEQDRIKDDGYIVLQATKVGLFPNVNQSVLKDDELLNHVRAVYDFIYNPFETQLMKQARVRGIPAYNGLKMLLFQGIRSYELWNDCIIESQMAQVIYERLKENI